MFSENPVFVISDVSTSLIFFPKTEWPSYILFLKYNPVLLFPWNIDRSQDRIFWSFLHPTKDRSSVSVLRNPSLLLGSDPPKITFNEYAPFDLILNCQTFNSVSEYHFPEFFRFNETSKGWANWNGLSIGSAGSRKEACRSLKLSTEGKMIKSSAKTDLSFSMRTGVPPCEICPFTITGKRIKRTMQMVYIFFRKIIFWTQWNSKIR